MLLFCIGKILTLHLIAGNENSALCSRATRGVDTRTITYTSNSL
jgi:hypothetical protein